MDGMPLGLEIRTSHIANWSFMALQAQTLSLMIMSLPHITNTHAQFHSPNQIQTQHEHFNRISEW